jgi:hypothetical protein
MIASWTWVTIRGKITGDQYEMSYNQLLFPISTTMHPLAAKPVFMDDNARPHRSRAVTTFLAAVVAAAIPDAMLLPINVSFVQEVQLPVHDGLACLKHALSDSNSSSWLAMEGTSRLHFEGRWLLPLNDAAWHCHP